MIAGDGGGFRLITVLEPRLLGIHRLRCSAVPVAFAREPINAVIIVRGGDARRVGLAPSALLARQYRALAY